MWTIFKVFIEFVTILLLGFFFMFWFFGCEARGILAPRAGIKPAPPALEGEVLTTGLPAKSLKFFIEVSFPPVLYSQYSENLFQVRQLTYCTHHPYG